MTLALILFAIICALAGLGLLGAAAFVMFWSAALTIAFAASVVIVMAAWLFALPGLLLDRLRRAPA